MRFTQEGEWVVSSPLIAGTQAVVDRALRCAHSSWAEETRAVEQGHLMILERCGDCKGATRVKCRPATVSELERKP